MVLELLAQNNYLSKMHQPLILAVDDDEDNLELLTEVLYPLNCHIITAKDGRSTISIAQQQRPDLILLDILLPDICGTEITRMLKQNPQTQNITVIAVTALARAEDRESLLAAGCSAYISKPYMLDDLEAVICRYLGLNPTLAFV
ncbi:response regulator [Chroococcidiopsis cubana SAG 39.79]|jgi:two-component system, cell cycle response regulator DivK|uniref:Response regulator receiver protein n=3 Tax=Chroococcidiopsidaceae TaxID=1890528 RepID=K9TZ18_CHRTP|nr:response regulator receiver protein [Chroococcidiopsis thermalis PCC 7203]MBE9020203.1 response regulator [Chroococcidiopsidales cyanobacterium LEGE 13417]PSB63278.1 response regulator [Chroococcidiopsis cubana CCALA 043]PSM46455.1 response regulator [Chroococcidiopsis sp. CCALA 051]RUT09390.1 response regulator [Chroococcidiopsis cubana SAG 39.79]